MRKLRTWDRLHFYLDVSLSTFGGRRLTPVKEVSKKKKKKDANGSKLVVIDYFSYPGLVAQMSQKDIAKSTKFVLPQMTALSSR